jgi:mono/diheme cytochrome c family protein
MLRPHDIVDEDELLDLSDVVEGDAAEPVENEADAGPATEQQLIWDFTRKILGGTTAIALVSLIIFVLNIRALNIAGKLGGDPLASQSGPADMQLTDMSLGGLVYLQNCASCHGQNLQGVPRMGLPLANSPFVKNSGDEQLMHLIEFGRTADDPASKMKVPMPAKGGNATLSPADVRELVKFLRDIQTQASQQRAGV